MSWKFPVILLSYTYKRNKKIILAGNVFHSYIFFYITLKKQDNGYKK